MEEVNHGRIEQVNIDQQMRSAYIDYSMSVIAVSYTHLTLPTILLV